ncbi:MAG: hypothetical protein K1X55_07845 [Chitinophagales bacterium]|nr:hypothetical protein [Chitinophagales bacterium]
MKKVLIGAGIFFGIAAAIALGIIIAKPLEKYAVKMKLEDNLGIYVNNKIPLKAEVTENPTISILDDLNTTIDVTDRLTIDLNDVIDVPLRMNLRVPLNTELLMNDILDLEFDLPVDISLDQTEMPLNGLVIPFNQKLMINDSIPLDVVIPMDQKMKTIMGMKIPVKGNIPVKLMVPIQQELTVSDTIVLNAQDYDVPLRTTIPVKAKVPVNQKIHIEGTLDVPVDQMVQIPLKKVISTPVLNKFNATVKSNTPVKVSMSELQAQAGFSEPLKVSMEELTIDPSQIKIEPKKKKE